MTILEKAIPYLYDCGIDGVGYLIAYELTADQTAALRGILPSEEIGEDLLVERRDSSEEMSENKLDRSYWRSQRSWHMGAGQIRFDAPKVSDPNAFFDSKGFDVTTELGQATLLPEVSRILALTNQGSAPQKMIANDTSVFVAAGQPNLKKFTNLTASDVSNVSTGTETAQEVFGLATDGLVIYAALGVDGTHKSGVVTTQREAFDVTTGWSGTGTLAIDTMVKQEGAASIKVSGIPAINKVKTVGPWDLSTQDTIQVWVRWSDYIRFSDGRLRLETNSTNYFERSFAGLGIPIDTWYRDVSSRDQWTSIGAPNWANITAIRILRNSESPFILNTSTLSGTDVLNGGGPSIWFDDLSTTTSGALAHYSDWDSRVISWAKDRLFGAGIKSGTQWRFFEVGSGATSTERLALPDGWVVTDIQELGGFIYFTANRGPRAVVYAWDGNPSNTPFIAVSLPNGEMPVRMISFLGAGMLIATRRVSSSAQGGQGIIYRAFPTASGGLTLERIQTFGSDDGKDYSTRCGFSYGDFVYFGYPYTDASSCGLGVYVPETGAYARNLEAAVTGTVDDALIFKGKKLFSVAGSGVFAELANYVSSGNIVSSLIDWNIDGPKVLLKGEIGYKVLPAGTKIALEYSNDDGTTWLPIVTGDSGERAAGKIYQTVQTAKYRVTGYSDSNKATSPALKKAGLSAIYAEKPRYVHRVAIKAFDRMSLRNREDYPGSGPGLAASITSKLKSLRDSQKIVQYQPPGYGLEHTDIHDVRIASLNVIRRWETGAGFANLVLLEIVEVPT